MTKSPERKMLGVARDATNLEFVICRSSRMMVALLAGQHVRGLERVPP